MGEDVAAAAFLGRAKRLERQIVALRDRQLRYLELGLSCGEEGRERMRALAAEIEARVAAYAEGVRQVERVIDAMEEARYREILRYRYLNGWSMRRIAKEMGYSEDWAYRLHRRALRAAERRLRGSEGGGTV